MVNITVLMLDYIHYKHNNHDEIAKKFVRKII